MITSGMSGPATQEAQPAAKIGTPSLPNGSGSAESPKSWFGRAKDKAENVASAVWKKVKDEVKGIAASARRAYSWENLSPIVDQALSNPANDLIGAGLTIRGVKTGVQAIKGGAKAIKAVKNVGKHVDDVIDASFKGKLPKGKVFPPEAMKELAKAKGWREVNGQFPHGEKVYYDPKNKVYISRDSKGHIGGSLKIAKKPEDLFIDGKRMGTYTPDMIRIGK